MARVVVKLGWTRYRLSITGEGIDAHEVSHYDGTSGYRQLELTDWVDALTADLRERAWANGHLRANLARLVA